MQGLRECFKCDRVLSLDDFYKTKSHQMVIPLIAKDCMKTHSAKPEIRRKTLKEKVRRLRKGEPKIYRDYRKQQGKGGMEKNLDSGLVTGVLDTLYATETCVYCRQFVEPKNRTMDHVIPLKRRIASSDNLVMACGSCNFKKSALTGKNS